MYRIFIRGVVQGVGFRPYIYRKAVNAGLKGFVRNTGSGVEVIVNDKDFVERLKDLPPMARITDYETAEIEGEYKDFSIVESRDDQGSTTVPADIFCCSDCLRELRDGGDRRHGYYFITCTNCGPRFTIVENYPYDRPLTSMKDFKMCPDCEAEYKDPMSRRYHAQTNACKKCGPKLSLKIGGKYSGLKSDDAIIAKTAEMINAGEMVAIKGVGGFHICCRPDDVAVGKVRSFLGRANKPFAVMVKDVEEAGKFAQIGVNERKLLTCPQRPIVVLKKKRPCFEAVSELDSIGVMLPYTGLHYLLFDHFRGPLVMTSSNMPGEPVDTEGALANNMLTHGRRIVSRCDDSVAKVVGDKKMFLRRSRGYAPLSVGMNMDCEDTIALGAEINNAVCAAKDGKCFMSQYIGDCSKQKTAKFMEDAVESLIKMTRLKPKKIVCDMHPGYASTEYAQRLSEKYGTELLRVQHHMAHVESAAREHSLTEYVGIAADGLGYGADGTLWGGEVFNSDGGVIERVGGLQTQPQLGGDSSAIYPKKMLFGILSDIVGEGELTDLGLFPEADSRLYLRQLDEGFNVAQTSSAGRILDAVAAFLGLCDERTYDGRPAMILESAATEPLRLEPKITNHEGREILSTSELFRFLLENKKEDVGILAATAQAYLASGLYEIAEKTAGDREIVFSGGVAYNKMITGYMLEKGVLINKDIPAGDGGVCFGQACFANKIQ